MGQYQNIKISIFASCIENFKFLDPFVEFLEIV